MTACRIGSLIGPKLRYLRDQNKPNKEKHKTKYWLFLNTKMNVTNSSKLDEKVAPFV